MDPRLPHMEPPPHNGFGWGFYPYYASNAPLQELPPLGAPAPMSYFYPSAQPLQPLSGDNSTGSGAGEGARTSLIDNVAIQSVASHAASKGLSMTSHLSVASPHKPIPTATQMPEVVQDLELRNILVFFISQFTEGVPNDPSLMLPGCTLEYCQKRVDDAKAEDPEYYGRLHAAVSKDLSYRSRSGAPDFWRRALRAPLQEHRKANTNTGAGAGAGSGAGSGASTGSARAALKRRLVEVSKKVDDKKATEPALPLQVAIPIPKRRKTSHKQAIQMPPASIPQVASVIKDLHPDGGVAS